MRELIFAIFIVLTAALAGCVVVSSRSRKTIAPSLALLVASLIPPMIGNMFITISTNQVFSTIGYYIYFIGMDIVVFALLEFTVVYCHILWFDKKFRIPVYLVLIMDVAQILCNPFFHHSFETEVVTVAGSAYYRLLPYIGQTIHRIVCYGIFLGVLFVFFVKMIRSPRIYMEKYLIILLTMVFTGAWETYYIFSRTPIDRSMIGFGTFGLLVFYFALYYRPVRLLDRLLANIVQDMSAALFFFDANGRCVWANGSGIELVGIEDNNFEKGTDLLNKMFKGLDLEANGWNCQTTLGTGSAKRYYAIEKNAVKDRKRVVGSFLRINDETELQIKLLREKYSATHDSLTGLYTKEHLYERVQEKIRSNPGVTYYIVYLDVKDFKMINDVFGNDFGDYVLQDIANSIRHSLPAGCVYGRLSGDTFGSCIPESEFSAEIAESFLVNYTVKTESIEHKILIHQGVYEVNEPDLDVSVMFDRAHIALDSIKEDYTRYVAFYDNEMRDKMLWDQQITAQLSDALKERQICPYLQAIVNGSGRVVGAEALVRWINPTSGFLSPAMFVPVFEKNGMIAEVDRYMWRSACEILARWKEEGHDGLFISVNVSPKDFYFMDVVSTLKAITDEYGVERSRLRVEITETVMFTDNINRVQLLNELKEAGFIVEMDDFGSGYSSLNMLKDIPVDVIKIDMRFLDQSKNDCKAQTILSNIMRLTDDLGISSLTEGVETQAQYQMLSKMGCKLFQGYHFAKPMPVDKFEECFFAES